MGDGLLPTILPPAVDETRPAEEEDLQAPIDDDEGLAEIELAEHLRRQQDVIDDEKAERQEARRPHDVDEIGDRGEAPFRLIEVGSPIDERGARQRDRKDKRQMLQEAREARLVEAQLERHEHSERRHHEIVDDDRHLLRFVQLFFRDHFVLSLAAGPRWLRLHLAGGRDKDHVLARADGACPAGGLENASSVRKSPIRLPKSKRLRGFTGFCRHYMKDTA